jgi:hypothetical protein
VRRLGSAAATPAFLGRLTELLRDPDSDVQLRAAGVVKALGLAVVTKPSLLKAVSEMLDSDDGVTNGTIDVIGTLKRVGVRFRRQNGRLVPQLVADLSRCEER